MRRTPWSVAAIAIALAFGWSVRTSVVHASEDSEAARPEFYTSRVQPIFRSSCYRCHAGMNRRGGLSMSTRAALMKGGKDGVVVLPGDPAKSLLVKGIRHEPPAKPMPSKGRRLSDADIATIERWIRAGAVMPEDAPIQ
ncbi:MAG TPA: c-type cytochrome domain-containing protein [Edaphobacter sp.]|nr:c-type cytochrome domain-containing protein [Edaphobacter sp.]